MVLCGVHTGEQTVASIDYIHEREVQRMSFPLSLYHDLFTAINVINAPSPISTSAML